MHITRTHAVLALAGIIGIAEATRRRMKHNDQALSLEGARQTVRLVAQMDGDDVILALAITGGGAPTGPSIVLPNGDERLLQHLKMHFIYDPASQTRAKVGSPVALPVHPDDFYDTDIMTRVNLVAGDTALFQAAAEYAATKITTFHELYRLWRSIHAISDGPRQLLQISHAVYEAGTQYWIGETYLSFRDFFHEGFTAASIDLHVPAPTDGDIISVGTG